MIVRAPLGELVAGHLTALFRKSVIDQFDFPFQIEFVTPIGQVGCISDHG